MCTAAQFMFVNISDGPHHSGLGTRTGLQPRKGWSSWLHWSLKVYRQRLLPYSIFPIVHCSPPAVYLYIHGPLIPLSSIFQSKHFSTCQSSHRLLHLLPFLSFVCVSSVPLPLFSSSLLFLLIAVYVSFPLFFYHPSPPFLISLIYSPPHLTPLHHPVCLLCRLGPLRPSWCEFFYSHSPYLTSPSFLTLFFFSFHLCSLVSLFFSSWLLQHHHHTDTPLTPPIARNRPPSLWSLPLWLAGCAFRQCSLAVLSVANQGRSLQQMLEIRWRQAQPIATHIHMLRAATDVPCLSNRILVYRPLTATYSRDPKCKFEGKFDLSFPTGGSRSLVHACLLIGAQPSPSPCYHHMR